MKRKYISHSAQTKIRAVEMFLQEKKSQKEIADYFGVAVQRIKDWVWMYRQKGELGFMQKRGRPTGKEDMQAEIVRLKMENDLLKKFHTELRKAMLAKRNIGLSITTKKSTK
jgi:transposase